MAYSSSVLRVVPPQNVDQYQAENKGALPIDEQPQDYTRLCGYIRNQYDIMRNHRASQHGWNERMLHAQRTFNGEYHPAKLAEIKQFGGSEIYARVVAVKCRGASALLRDVYLGPDRSWGLEATPEPTLPDKVANAVMGLVNTEIQTMQTAGQPITPEKIRDRVQSLMGAASRAAKHRAADEAKRAEDKLDDLLVEGQFYKAMAEMLIDIPLFPFCAVKGPVVRIVPLVTWKDGKPVTEMRPRMFWQRVSPFDLYWTPGVSDIEDASVIERVRYTRADLNAVVGLPGYDEQAVRSVLREYGTSGFNEWLDATDSQRADNESRENPVWNRSGMIQGIEFHGSVQGDMLLEQGFSADVITDPDLDYFIQAWVIGRFVIKCQIAPSPRKRHPYYITSFEKVPGTPVGNALPDILEHIQDSCNASLRALLNNMSIASGPQVVINDEAITEGSDNDELYPWKRWHASVDPMAQGAARPPVEFFQPTSNAQELLGVYEKFTQMADELSAIPRYVTGSERLGGAGRTASGLAMLMGNASKVLQNVAGNIDRDIISPLLQSLYDMVMLTDDTGMFRGDESIRVKGVAVAVQRETNRQRQMEFLTATANPIDLDIMGKQGRANVLRAVSDELGMDGANIVPSEEDLREQEQAKIIQAQQMQMQQQAEAEAGIGQPQPGVPGGPARKAPQGPGQAPQAATQMPGSQGSSGPGALPAMGNSIPKPSNQALGVPEAKTMRGMA